MSALWTVYTVDVLDAPNLLQLSLITGLTKCIISSSNLIVPTVAVFTRQGKSIVIIYCVILTQAREIYWRYLFLGGCFLFF